MYLMCWIDNIFNTIKPYKRHYFVVLIYLIGYLIVNVIVTVTVRRVYDIISWTSLMSYVYAIIALLLSLIHFSILMLYYRKVK